MSNSVDIVAKKIAYDGLVKKNNVIGSNKQNLKKKIDKVDKLIPDTNKCIETQDLNRSTKIDLKMRECRIIQKPCI